MICCVVFKTVRLVSRTRQATPRSPMVRDQALMTLVSGRHAVASQSFVVPDIGPPYIKLLLLKQLRGTLNGITHERTIGFVPRPRNNQAHGASY